MRSGVTPLLYQVVGSSNNAAVVNEHCAHRHFGYCCPLHIRAHTFTAALRTRHPYLVADVMSCIQHVLSASCIHTDGNEWLLQGWLTFLASSNAVAMNNLSSSSCCNALPTADGP